MRLIRRGPDRSSCRPAFRLVAVVLAVVVGGLFGEEPPAPRQAVDGLPRQHLPFAWRSAPVWGGGAVMTVEISPHDPNLILAGSDVGGVFRSEDAGRSWRSASRGLDTRGDRAVADFLWDGADPAVVYLAAGECFGRPRGRYGGLWRSSDFGKSWVLVSREVRFSGFGSLRQWGNVLTFDPADGSLLAGTAWDGVMRSNDDGRTWDRLGLDGRFIVGVAYGPKGTLYTAAFPTKTSPGGVWVSSDRGRSWSGRLAKEKVRSIAADSHRAGRVYVAVRDRGVLVSDDHGETWRLSNSGIEAFLDKQWANAVAVNPAIPDRVYLAACERFGAVREWWRWRHPGLFMSRDGGARWGPIVGNAMVNGRFDASVWLRHVDTGGWWKSAGWFCFNPMGWAVEPKRGERLFIHDFYGVWASDDGGVQWRAAMNGLAVTCARAIVCDPTRKGRAWFGFADVQLFRTDDAGRSVRVLSGYPTSNCTNLALETRRGGATLYSVADRKRLVLSTDGGETWRDAFAQPPKGSKLGGAVLDSFQPDGLYCGRWYTPDGGRSWAALALPEAWRGQVVPDPTQEKRLYAWSQRGVRRSTDGGRTWENADRGVPEVHPGKRIIRAFAVLPATGRIFVGSDVHGLLCSDDRGEHWRTLLPDCYVSAVGCGVDGRTVVAGAWRPWFAPESRDARFRPGVFLSRDGGDTWRRIDGTLGNVAPPSVLVVDPTMPGRVWLGTSGNAVLIGEFGE
ncbi:MAG: hypothetical protein GXP31_08705 [Kiritimatiellaeota bacterium]|nr:hypothetical protein [Kiritimatiellota bacterium]